MQERGCIVQNKLFMHSAASFLHIERNINTTSVDPKCFTDGQENNKKK